MATIYWNFGSSVWQTADPGFKASQRLAYWSGQSDNDNNGGFIYYKVSYDTSGHVLYLQYRLAAKNSSISGSRTGWICSGAGYYGGSDWALRIRRYEGSNFTNIVNYSPTSVTGIASDSTLAKLARFQQNTSLQYHQASSDGSTVPAIWSVNVTSYRGLAITAYIKLAWYRKYVYSGSSYNEFFQLVSKGNLGLCTLPQCQWTVSYNANGHGTAPASQTKYAGDDLTVAGAINAGNTAGSATTYTITGNANGNTWSGSNGSATRTPTYSWTQQSWNTASNGSGSGIALGGQFTGNGALTLYAIWSSSVVSYSYTYTLPTGTPTKASTNANSYTVAYNANGGTGSIATQTSTKTTSYSFKGWFTAASGGTQRTTSSQVSASETVYAQMNSSTTQNAVTLSNGSGFSKSSSSTFTVSYNLNGKSGTAPSSQTATKTITYAITKWAKDSASGTQYNKSASFTPTANTTMYAIWDSGTPSTTSVTLAAAQGNWTATENGYTITFNANGGTTTKTSQTATRTLIKSFNKWAAGSTSGTQYNAGATYTPTANVTMYALWNSTIDSQGTVTLPTDTQCTRDGYTLLGWSTSSTATTATYAPGATYTANATTTLYAVWELSIIGTGAYVRHNNAWEICVPFVHNGEEWKFSPISVRNNSEWK